MGTEANLLIENELLRELFDAWHETRWVRSEEERLREIQRRWYEKLWELGEVIDEPA